LGVGYVIRQASDYLNTALVFSGILAMRWSALAAGRRGLLLPADPSRRR
jgi:ABC-type nitrate/sulfonate/bicarbonate transport system permease component